MYHISFDGLCLEIRTLFGYFLYVFLVKFKFYVISFCDNIVLLFSSFGL